jgi:hypothetical protein
MAASVEREQPHVAQARALDGASGAHKMAIAALSRVLTRRALIRRVSIRLGSIVFCP